MNAKFSARLRVECLETRSLLSAIGLPLVPPAAPPWALAAAGEFSRIGGQHVAHAAMQDTVQYAAAMPSVNPTLAPVRLSPGLGDLPYEQSAAEGRFGDRTPAHDFHSTDDPTNTTPLLLGSTFDALQGLADPGSLPAIQNLPDTSQAVNLDPTQWHGDKAATEVAIDVSLVLPSLEVSQNSLPLSRDVADDRSVPTTPMIPDLSPSQLSGQVAPDAPAAFDPAELVLGMSEAQFVIEISPLIHGPAGFRGPLGRTIDPAIQSVIGNDVSPSVESSVSATSPALLASTVKGSTADMLAAADTSKFGDQAFAALETSLAASSGVAISPAFNAAFSSMASSNSLEDGFITLDASTTTPRLGDGSSYNTGFNGVEGAVVDRGIWLTDALPGTRYPADSAGGSSKAVPSGEWVAAKVARPAALILQPVAEVKQGGSIELAIGAPASADDLQPAGESIVGDASQQLAEIRPESGVGLFCDIEVAVAPTSPMGGSAAIFQNTDPFLGGVGIPAGKAKTATEFASPPTKWPQLTMAGLAENLPLLLGVTVLVSRGGLRLEESNSQRERRLCSMEDLWRSSR